jgi:peroxiredoxin Q/BCP
MTIPQRYTRRMKPKTMTNPISSARLAVLSVVFLLSVVPARADMLAAGAHFPDWTLPDQTGAARSSTELVGKPYLLWFYPRASTPGCTAEGRGFRDAYAELQGEGLAIIGVSFDAPEANAEFARAEEFPFPLLSDTSKSLAIAVGAADSPSQWMARRVSYLVGPDGVVWVAYDSVDPRGHAAQVLADMRSKRATPSQLQGGQSNEAD